VPPVPTESSSGWTFDQVTANEYLPGQGISAHTDTPGAFGPFLCSLSLLSDVVMEMQASASASSSASSLSSSSSSSTIRRPVMLPRRSLLVMSGPSRYDWTHAIAPRERDRIGARLVPRTRRVSLTLRQVAWGTALAELETGPGGGGGAEGSASGGRATRAPAALFSSSLRGEVGDAKVGADA